MTPAFTTALVDTLLPGEPATSPRRHPLPSGSSAGVTLAKLADESGVVLQAVLDRGGGAAGFLRANEEVRVAILKAVEREAGGAFRRFVMELLQVYCESAAVLHAMGSSMEPPQPAGRELPPTDQATLDLLEAVRARGPIWR